MSDNNVANNSNGIGLGSSSNSTVSDNNITNSTSGGVVLFSSSNNVVSGNNITTNGYGIRLLPFCSGNVFSGNNVAENYWMGVYINESSDNVFYHNNFVDNAQQIYTLSSTNVWDDGYPSGGNYWSNYDGADANHDGIADTAYTTKDTNIDHYPLMTIYKIPEFPSFLIVTLFTIGAVLTVIAYKRKHPE
jgi:parallel beta-helix repeat protein